MKRFATVLFIGVVFSMLCSCVSSRKFEDQKALTEKYKAEKEACEENLNLAYKENETQDERIRQLEKAKQYLVSDTSSLGLRYRKIERLNNELNELYEKLITQNKDLASASAAEREKLSLELAKKERDLLLKEEELGELETSLSERESSIEALKKDLDSREIRVAELEGLLSRQDSAVARLKAKIQNALVGFSADELTVEVKDGKVYVSLSEQLLFKSGSSDVDSKGKEAIVKVSEVLEKQTDISVIVEGHTDNVPYSSSSGKVKDNWDLSVLRATNVVRIMTDAGLSKERVIPSGRGEFLPVADNSTKEGRAKNRRTEIILSPDLDELFDLLENN